MLSKIKKLLSVFLILSIVMISTTSVFAKDQVKIDKVDANRVKVVDNGKINYIKVVEDDEYRNVYIEDENGNIVGNFKYNKTTGELYSSFAGKTFETQNEENVENKLNLFSAGNRSIGCDPNGTYTKSPNKLSYNQLLDYMGNVVTAAQITAAVVAFFGIAIGEVAYQVVELVSDALDLIQSKNETYLNNHGIKFYYSGRCNYDHRAQRYLVSYGIVKAERY